MRGYDQLARAYHLKGWYSQCDEALQKALELGSNDGRTNALAARRALAKQQFGESYQFFRKAHSLNPNEPPWVYVAAEIIFRMDLDDVAEKWMQEALEKEANPQRHQMMECYRMMWRRKFAAAGALCPKPDRSAFQRRKLIEYSVFLLKTRNLGSGIHL